MAEKEIDEHSGVETTGHAWDGIKELNNPLPRWWLIVFYASVVFSIVYWVFMPAWPGITGYTKGLREHSERENVAAAVLALETARADRMNQLLSAQTLQQIENDPELHEFARAAGQSLFGDNCATCHGAGGQGFRGYPNLNDDDWIWGGSLDAIEQTIHVGIRADAAETRQNVMQAYGASGALSADMIDDLVDYVVDLSGGEANNAAAARAQPVFMQQCAACHGDDGAGDQALGAPNLTDQIWLYGGERQAIRDSIYYGRAGVMPHWTNRLSDAQIAALAVYVHGLGGGE